MWSACLHGRRLSATSCSRPAPPACPSSPAGERAPPSSSTGRWRPSSSTIPRTWTRSAPRSPGRSGPRAPPSATRRDGWPSGCRGTRTSSAWRRSSLRWRVSGDPRPSLIRGGLRAWLAPGVRRAGVLRKSFFVTREVPGALTANRCWQAILGEPDAGRRRAGRRALARALGDLFRRLHAAGVYHNDLKDVNVLVSGPPGDPRCVLLDLERVRVLRRV